MLVDSEEYAHLYDSENEDYVDPLEGTSEQILVKRKKKANSK